ncbi:MAG TPA: hypothetical protein VFW68_08260 [Rhodocyclaceae bacterium]|nr:hypothetical protein [Rhodocyclaceae bacterium]
MSAAMSLVIAASAMILTTLALLLRPWRHLQSQAAGRGDLPGQRTSIGLVLVLPLVAGLLYGLIGNRAALDSADLNAAHGDKAADIDGMVKSLARKLEQNPDDPKGWLMLARSWKVMGRYGEAEQAFAKAGAVVDTDADLLTEYADVTAMGHGGQLDGKPATLVRKALALNPDHPTALWMAGTAAYQHKQYAEARRHWQRLLDKLPSDSQDREVIQANLEEIRLLLGEKAPKEEAKPTTHAVAGPVENAAAIAHAPAPAVPAATAIRGTVKLAPALMKQVAPEDAVFIFARAEEGPRMPLAVLRAKASELPLDFELDAGKADHLVVEARVSKHGDVKAQSGDLIGQRSGVKSGARGVAVVVDQVN